MMHRWYKAFTSTKPAEQVRAQIEDVVRQFGLEEHIFVCYLQRRWRRGDQNYLFLGLYSDEVGTCSPQLQIAIRRMNYIAPCASVAKSFSLEQIENMVGDCEAFDTTVSIRYRPQPTEVSPFGADEESANVSCLELQWDQLLLWLSCLGSGRWEKLHAACVELGMCGDGITPRRIARALRVAGHLELCPEGKRWAVTPTALVRRAGVGFLCGARDEVLLQALADVGQVAHTNPASFGPPRIRVQSDSEHLDVGPIQDLGVAIVDDASTFLAGQAPTLDEWMRQLRWVHLNPYLYNWSRWHGGHCVAGPFTDASGFYEVAELDGGPPSPRQRAFYYDQTSRRWYVGDWYGLRFLASVREGHCPQMEYHTTRRQLAVNKSDRLPELYERLLVLSSGLTPSENGPWLIYEDIERETLENLKQKLPIDVRDRTGEASA